MTGDARAPHLIYRRHSRRAAAVAGGLVCLLLVAPLVAGMGYLGMDLTLIEEGTLCALRRLLQVDASLWISPHLGNGIPLVGLPASQFFYPPRWLSLLLPQTLGVAFTVVFHIGLGAAAATWLGRTFGLRPAYAVAAGVCFGLSGTVLNLIQHPVYLIAALWLPLTWAAARRAAHPRAGWGCTLVVGLGLAGATLGAEPQCFAIAAGLVLLEALRALVRGGRAAAPRAGRLCALIPIAFILSAPQWFPFLAEAAITKRSGVLSMEQALRWSFDASLWPAALWPPVRFEALIPGVNIWRLSADDPAAFTWNSTPYLGAPLVVAAVCGLVMRRGRSAVLVLGAGLLLALGDATPLGAMLVKLLPPLGLFRYPQKYLVVTSLAAVVVALLFAQRLVYRRSLARRFLLAGGALGLGQLLALAALLAWRDSLDAAVAWPESFPRLSGLLLAAGGQATVATLVALMVVALTPRLRRLLPAVLALDLLAASFASVYVGPPLDDLSSPLDTLRDDGAIAVICVPYFRVELQDAAGRPLGGDRAWNLAALWRLYLVPELHACAGVASPLSYSPLQPRLNERLAGEMERGRAAAARALGCTHLLSDEVPADGGVEPLTMVAASPGARAVLEAGPRLYRVAAPVPRAFVATGAQLVHSEDDAFERLRSGADAAQLLAVVDDPLMRLDVAQLPDGKRASIRALSWPDPAAAEIELVGAGGAVVGLRTSFQVGWSAEQQGRALSVVRASGQHLAAVVPDVGAGAVRFSYRPPRLKMGLVAAALGALALVGVTLGAARSRRRGGRR